MKIVVSVDHVDANNTSIPKTVQIDTSTAINLLVLETPGLRNNNVIVEKKTVIFNITAFSQPKLINHKTSKSEVASNNPHLAF